MFRNPLIDTVVVLFVVLLFFGPKRLPALGHGLREFKHSITAGSDGADEADKAALSSADAAAAAPSAAAQAEPGELDSPQRRS